MQRSSAKRRIGSHAPLAAIVLNPGARESETGRAGLYLVLFMRFVAVLWIVEGLLHWDTVLSSATDGRSSILSMPMAEMSAIVFFAIIDLIATVGLWLATPWGGVIWLFSAGAQVLVAVLLPGFYPYRWLIVFANLGLVSLYMLLTWRAAAAHPRAALSAERLHPRRAD